MTTQTNPADDMTDANDVVSPENTEKLYGKKADQKEPPAGQEATLETREPDDVDGIANENNFSNPE